VQRVGVFFGMSIFASFFDMTGEYVDGIDTSAIG
jgi:hypothetical protein